MYRIPITTVVAANPMTPNILVGAKTLRFFSKHNGNRPTNVMRSKDTVRETSTPTAAKRDRKVSAKIMLYAKFPKAGFVQLTKLTNMANPSLSPIVSSQTSL
jgi:hypothetical protein